MACYSGPFAESNRDGAELIFDLLTNRCQYLTLARDETSQNLVGLDRDGNRRAGTDKSTPICTHGTFEGLPGADPGPGSNKSGQRPRAFLAGLHPVSTSA